MPLDFPNNPATNDTYSSGGYTWRFDGTRWKVAPSTNPTYQTALPSSPVDGQEIYYAADAANGVIWHLRYRSGGGTYKWEFVGGGQLRAIDNDFRTITNVTSFSSSGSPPYPSDVPDDTITLTIPLAGEYLVTHIAWMVVASGQNRAGLTGLAITNASNTIQTAASDDISAIVYTPSSTGTLQTTASTTNLFTITTAGWKLREQGRTEGNYSLNVQRRRVFVTPIRVG